VKFTKGIKISEEDAATLNKARKGRTFRSAPGRQAEVEGQSSELIFIEVECPWCGKKQWIHYDPGDYLWYTCCFCQGAYLDPICP
jgi:hypothetical protein